MNAVIERNAEKIRESIDPEILENMTRDFTFADLIRMGSNVSGQAYGWTDPDGNMCAMSAAVAAGKAVNIF